MSGDKNIDGEEKVSLNNAIKLLCYLLYVETVFNFSICEVNSGAMLCGKLLLSTTIHRRAENRD